jgi:hypothetical protein
VFRFADLACQSLLPPTRGRWRRSERAQVELRTLSAPFQGTCGAREQEGMPSFISGARFGPLTLALVAAEGRAKPSAPLRDKKKRVSRRGAEGAEGGIFPNLLTVFNYDGLVKIGWEPILSGASGQRNGPCRPSGGRLEASESPPCPDGTQPCCRPADAPRADNSPGRVDSNRWNTANCWRRT